MVKFKQGSEFRYVVHNGIIYGGLIKTASAWNDDPAQFSDGSSPVTVVGPVVGTVEHEVTKEIAEGGPLLDGSGNQYFPLR